MSEPVCPYCKGAATVEDLEPIHYYKVVKVKVPPPPYGRDLKLYTEKRQCCGVGGVTFLKCSKCRSIWIYKYSLGATGGETRDGGNSWIWCKYLKENYKESEWVNTSKENYNDHVREWRRQKRIAEAQETEK